MAFQLEGIQRLPDCTKGILANEALTVGELIMNDANGFATAATADATNITILGIVKVAATGSAVSGAVSVTYTPLPEGQWLRGLTDGNPLTDAMMGKLCKLQDSNTVNTAASPLAGVVGFKLCKIVDVTNKIAEGYLSIG